MTREQLINAATELNDLLFENPDIEGIQISSDNNKIKEDIIKAALKCLKKDDYLSNNTKHVLNKLGIIVKGDEYILTNISKLRNTIQTTFSKRRKKKDHNNTQFIGGFIPNEIFSALTLYCLPKSISKNDVINDLFNTWYKNNWSNKRKREHIIKDIINISQHEWDLTKRANSIKDTEKEFSNFKKEFAKFLLNRHVLKEYVDHIINKLSI